MQTENRYRQYSIVYIVSPFLPDLSLFWLLVGGIANPVDSGLSPYCESAADGPSSA